MSKAKPAPIKPARTYYAHPWNRITGHYTVAWERNGQEFTHSARLRLTDFEGNWPSIYSIARLPVSLLSWVETRARRGMRKPLPLLVYDAIKQIEATANPGRRVLEIGGGNSTLWFLSRGVSVVCVESSPEWAEFIREEAVRLGCASSLSLHVLAGADALSVVEGLSDGSFDLLLVDSDSSKNWRADFIRAGRPKVRKGGLVVLDNSDHPNHWSAVAEMGEGGRKFTGFFPMGLVVSQTTIWEV